MLVEWDTDMSSASLIEVLAQFDVSDLPLEVFLTSIRSDLDRWQREQMATMVDLNGKSSPEFCIFMSRIREILEEFDAKTQGLCLHCVRTEQRHAGSCTLQH